MYLLDTNICIDFARGRREPLRAKMMESFDDGLAMSAITLAELQVGARIGGSATDDRELLDRLITALTLHPFDSAAAITYGQIARVIGVRRKSFDRLIAAHALSMDLILVTSDVRGFSDVPGLRLEDWTQ